MSPRTKQVLLILAILVTVVTVDQVTKALIRTAYPEPLTSIRLGPVPQFFQLSHQRNYGLVGSLFDGKRYVTYLAPLFASLVLIYLFRYLSPQSKLQATAYGLIAGGAIGNLIDRLRLGYVTDFLQFHLYFIPFNFPWKVYPAFNVADSCICTGVFLLIVTWHFVEKNRVPDAA